MTLLSRRIQPAFYARDAWPRATAYQRRACLVDRFGDAVSCEGWTDVRVRAEGASGSRSSDLQASVKYDDTQGGEAMGAFILDFDPKVLDLDRVPNETDQNTVLYTVAIARPNGPHRVAFQVRLRVLDTAFA